MAHTKSGGSTALGRDSVSKRLGVKRADGSRVNPGMVLVRQRGTQYRPGANVQRGADDTLFALASGIVRYSTKKVRNFHGRMSSKTVVTISATA